MSHIYDRAVRNPTAEEIARVAYHLYLEQGAQQGYELDDWLRAEQLLLQQLNETNAPHSSPFAEGEEENPCHIRHEGDSPEQDGFIRWKDIRRANIPYRPPSRYSPPGQREHEYFTSI